MSGKGELSACGVQVEIERGMRDGHEIEFEGYGEHHPDQLPGKLIFKLVVGEEKQFDRKGHDLHAEMSILCLVWAQLRKFVKNGWNKK